MGQDFSVDLIIWLVQDYFNIIGIKDIVDNISYICEIINNVRLVCLDFVIFFGYDEYMMDMFILGGNGGILVIVNFVLQLICGIYCVWCEKEYEIMFGLQCRLFVFFIIYSLDLFFFGIIKKVIQFSGVDILIYVMFFVLLVNEEYILNLKQILQCVGF